ncbi:MAG: DUF2203 domain-containing protein [Phycisphaerae bacterium]
MTQSEHESLEAVQPRRGFEKYFTVEKADAALVLVRRIVQDVVPRFAQVLQLRDEANDLSGSAESGARLLEIREELIDLQQALNTLHAELERIGCALKDWQTGLVDFPAILEGREIWLCWHPNETAITHWHEIDNGFSHRQPLTPAQRLQIAKEAARD